MVDLYLRDPEKEVHFIEGKSKIYEGNLTYNGTYYLELICKSILCEFGGKFYSTILGNTETIDLNETHEFSFYTNGYISATNSGSNLIKVNNLNEEKIVYFSIIENFRRSTDYYYPFYPGESPPYIPDPYDYREKWF